MGVGVIDAGIAIGLLQRKHRSLARIQALLEVCRKGKGSLSISAVNLAEVLIHTAELVTATGVDPVALLSGFGVQVHSPDEAVARRVAKLKTSLADGFAAATALELGGRLHTTDTELARQLKGVKLPVSLY